MEGDPVELGVELLSKLEGEVSLAEAVDRAGADLILHGHAHRGAEKGVTPAAVHVRNVAESVIRHRYNVSCLGDGVLPSE
jgi:2',3'-cyclic-nucleotide 2'-phosphodiesterase (5'-nucleotidase family)